MTTSYVSFLVDNNNIICYYYNTKLMKGGQTIMTMEDLIKELMQHVDEYATEGYEPIMDGVEPRRKHKKKRVQKKWIKRYGMVPKYTMKKCKKIDVTLDMIVQYCRDYNMPLPDEILQMIRG